MSRACCRTVPLPGLAGSAGDDEPTPREQLPRMMFDLGHHAPRRFPTGRLVKKPGLKGFTAMRTKDLGLFGLLHRGQLALYRDFARQIELVGVKLKKRERLAHRLCRPRRVRV